MVISYTEVKMKKKRAPTTSNEKEIREYIREGYAAQYPNACIRDEFTTEGLEHRNDLFLVDENIIISIEIKSDKDNLRKLRSQCLEYLTYSSIVVIVLDQKHLKKFNKDFQDLKDHPNMITLIYHKDEYSSWTKAINNCQVKDFPDIFNLLWSSELLLFRSKLKNKSKIKNNSIASTKMINNTFSPEDKDLITKHLFIKRMREDTHRKIKYNPTLIDSVILDLIQENQDNYNNYLKGI